MALKPPSTVVTDIPQDPDVIAVTTPFALTVATDVFVDDHRTALFVAVGGKTNACRAYVLVGFNTTGRALIDNPDTGVVTTTVIVSLFCPSALVTVITVVPFDKGVTVSVICHKPKLGSENTVFNTGGVLLETTATLGLLDDQNTFILLGYAGKSVTVT
jgi:hypothetical protein